MPASPSTPDDRPSQPPPPADPPGGTSIP
jgi:hypothetical protein